MLVEPADPRTRKLKRSEFLTQQNRCRNGEWGEQSTMPNAQCSNSTIIHKISNNSVVQALHLKEIYVAPLPLGAVFQ